MVREVDRWHRRILAVGLFLLVWGGKLTVIDRFGSDLPWWDDWSAIGERLLVPYQQGTLEWRHFFAPHNEHRIVGTRVLDIALFAANGQWDARIECVVSAGLHALLVAAAFLVGSRLLPLAAQLAWFAALALLTAPPVVWENIIRGFDSQHYLLIGFSLAAIVLLLTARATEARWWGGVVCAVAALFTMGSGLVAPLAVMTVLFATTPSRDWFRVHRWTLLACVIVAGAGFALSHDVPAHAAHRAHTVREFSVALRHHLQWPLVHWPLFGAVSWLPWAWLAWRCVRRDSAMGTGERAVVAAGLWALAHYVAMAWMRGSLQPWPPVRGLENVVVGLAVNGLALLIAMSCVRWTGWRRWSCGAVAAVGVSTALFGLQAIIRENLTIVLPSLAAQARRVETNVREYVRTGDLDQLDPHDLPYPSANVFVTIVSRPEMREILPPSVRPRVALAGHALPDGSFSARGLPAGLDHPAGEPAMGSYVGDAANQGEWRSEPVLRRHFPYWQFDVFRSHATPALGLDLMKTDGPVVANLSTPGVGVRRWTTVTAKIPDEPIVLAARDQSETGWLAFTAPTEIGALSRCTRAVAERGWWLIAFGGVISTAAWALVFRVRL